MRAMFAAALLSAGFLALHIAVHLLDAGPRRITTTWRDAIRATCAGAFRPTCFFSNALATFAYRLYLKDLYEATQSVQLEPAANMWRARQLFCGASMTYGATGHAASIDMRSVKTRRAIALRFRDDDVGINRRCTRSIARAYASQ